MTFQIVQDPSAIESALTHIWENLAKSGKTRASLFNLIVFAKMGDRYDYTHKRVQKIVDTFPCRILFLTSQPKKNSFRIGVSVLFPQGEGDIACDTIDIAFSKKFEKKIPFLLLPHLLPDLPIYLLWTEDPTEKSPLFTSLVTLAVRLIFDSESSKNLCKFATSILAIEEKKGKEVADLNWARTESWRDLIADCFHDPLTLNKLQHAKKLLITFNKKTSLFCSHCKIQALYLQAWLASRLFWKKKRVSIYKGILSIYYQTEKGKELVIELRPDMHAELIPGAILSLEVFTRTKEHFLFRRDPKIPYQVWIASSTLEKCDLPISFLLGKDVSGLSLDKEIIFQGTSRHFRDALTLLSTIKNKKIC